MRDPEERQPTTQELTRAMDAYAAVATRPWQVRYLPVKTPDPGPDDVVIRVLQSWISNGTDGSFVRGERIAGDTPRQPSDPMPFPHVPGYQKVGVVESVGADVGEVAAGDAVFATMGGVHGMFYPWAGHISPSVTHRSQVWKLPAGLEPWTASGLVLTQVGYNVGIRPPIAPGDHVLVIGDGLVGHWAAQTYQHRGARVMLVGKHAERLERFTCRPGDRTLLLGQEDAVAAARAWAPEGVRVVADTVGTVASVEALYPAMGAQSHIVSAGFCGLRGAIDIQKMREREMTLHTPAGWAKDRLDATLDLLARGALSTQHLVTHRLPASRASEAFDLILFKGEAALGVVLDWE